MAVSVPLVPGVPALFEAVSTAEAAILLTRDLVSAFGSIDPQWGIFLGAVPVVLADNVVSVEYKQDWNLSDYPVEDGAFATYDKVNSPFDARIRFSAGATLLNPGGSDLLDSVAAIAGDLNLYNVRTPEATYADVNVVHYDYRRTARNGVGLIEVDVWVREVRVTGLSTFGNTALPSGADPANLGTVSAAPVTKVIAAPL
jgi:hypothetical protein